MRSGHWANVPKSAQVLRVPLYDDKGGITDLLVGESRMFS